MADRAAPTAKAPMVGRVRAEGLHGQHEPLARLGQHVLLGHAHVLEVDAHRVGQALSQSWGFGDPR